jgi:hypothetical protein
MKITRRQLRQIINETMSHDKAGLSRQDVADAWAETTERIESAAREKGLSAELKDAMKAGAQTLKTLLDNMV